MKNGVLVLASSRNHRDNKIVRVSPLRVTPPERAESRAQSEPSFRGMKRWAGPRRLQSSEPGPDAVQWVCTPREMHNRDKWPTANTWKRSPWQRLLCSALQRSVVPEFCLRSPAQWARGTGRPACASVCSSLMWQGIIYLRGVQRI